MFNASERDLSDDTEEGLKERVPGSCREVFLPSHFSIILLSLDFNCQRKTFFLVKLAVKFKHFSINLASVPCRNYCHEPKLTHRAANQGNHVKRKLRNKQNAPKLRTFLLEPSQSRPPPAPRCQTQPDLRRSLGPGSQAHGGKKRHGRFLGAERGVPITPLPRQVSPAASPAPRSSPGCSRPLSTDTCARNVGCTG